MNRSVGITGSGIVSSIGNNVLEFSESLRRGKSGIKKCIQKSDPVVSVDIAAKIEDFSFVTNLEKMTQVPPEAIRKARRLGQRAPFSIQTSILSAMETWQNANLFEKPAQNIGLVVCAQNTTQNYQYELIPKFKNNPEYLSPRYALEFLETNQIGVLSELLHIQGESFTVGGASATGNVGIIKALQAVSSGYLDACLVVGVVADLSPMDIQGFINIGAMGGKKFLQEPEKACRPFDMLHEGFIYGQAGACLVLESVESAQQRDAKIAAIIKGGAMNLDANSSADPNVEGEIAAMQTALERGGLKASDVDYVNTHGSSSALGDVTEAEAIQRVFQENASRVWLNSTKGLTGHCLFSAGVVEVVATLAQMKGGFVHPSKNLEQPIRDDLNFSPAAAADCDINVAMSNSFGFGGINTSVVLEKTEK